MPQLTASTEYGGLTEYQMAGLFSATGCAIYAVAYRNRTRQAGLNQVTSDTLMCPTVTCMNRWEMWPTYAVEFLVYRNEIEPDFAASRMRNMRGMKMLSF